MRFAAHDPSHACQLCVQGAKWRILASHRSGETEDTFLADITVGLACGQLKSGALARCEAPARLCKSANYCKSSLVI